MIRAAVAISRHGSAHFCSDRCGANARNVAAYRRRTEAVAPPIKWAGGKRWAVARLRRLYRTHRSRRLVEPFAGGLAVALGLRPDCALLNDANPVAARFYAMLADGFVVADDIAVDRARETYLANRARFNELHAAGRVDDEAAALFYVLVRTAFNGVWRTNKRGLMNVAWGGEGEPIERDLRSYSRVMRGWTFSAGDFARVALDDDDFLFLDPPYDAGFVGYGADGFSFADQVRLADYAAAHRGPIVAMNAATPRLLELYRTRGFTVRRVRAPRRISGDGDRTGTLEMLATRNVTGFDAVDGALEAVG